MMTAIQWTDATWNPVVGCSPVSEGCRNCYAAKEAIRLGGNPNEKISAMYAGTSEMRGLGSKRRAVFTGKVNLVPDRLGDPLRWRKPRRVFVNSMSDLFHEDVPFEFIDQVFAVMALAPQHTFQVLTKRPERMAEYMAGGLGADIRRQDVAEMAEQLAVNGQVPGRTTGEDVWMDAYDAGWPLPNVWLGTSVEDQAAADERIPHLLRTPATVRFLSCEPLLGPVDLTDLVVDDGRPGEWHIDSLRCDVHEDDDAPFYGATIDWVIAGGESGPGARPCDVEWIRALVGQCQTASVPVFVKQLGNKPTLDLTREATPYVLSVGHRIANQRANLLLRDRKGGDPAEWPEDLRVREYPRGVA